MARQKEFDRKAALERAMRLFWAKGYDGTSVSDLTDGMGLSRSSLYDTFGDKDDLFAETIAHYVETIDRRRARVLGAPGSARESLRVYFRGVIDFILKEDLPGGCFFTNTATALGSVDERVQAVIRRGDEKQEQDLLACLRRARDQGEIPPDRDLRALARFLGGLVRGLTVLARMHKGRKALEDVVTVGLSVLD